MSQEAAVTVAGLHNHLDMLLNVSGLLHNTDGVAPGKSFPVKLHYAASIAPLVNFELVGPHLRA